MGALTSKLLVMWAVILFLFLFLFAIIVLPFFVDGFFFAVFSFAPTSASGGCCHQFIVFVQGSTQGGLCVVIVVAAVVVPHSGWYHSAHFLSIVVTALAVPGAGASFRVRTEFALASSWRMSFSDASLWL